MQRKLDPTAERPLFRQLADDLRKRIGDEDFQPGQSLPRQSDLAAAYEVGIQTVRDATEVLRKEGRIVGVRGHAFHVAEPVEIQTITLAAGETVKGRVSGPAEREAHGVPEGAYVLVVTGPAGEKVYLADRTEIRGGSAGE